MIEREAKIPVPDREAAAERLQALGAVFDGGGRENNVLFDTPDRALERRGVALRVRTVAGRAGGGLTVKGADVGGAFKARVEHETRVDDPDALAHALTLLGFQPSRRYEKDRDEWTWRGAHIALDRLPFLGDFVEVEGDAALIAAVCEDLGLDPAAHVSLSYLALWSRFLAERGEAPRDLLFEKES